MRGKDILTVVPANRHLRPKEVETLTLLPAVKTVNVASSGLNCHGQQWSVRLDVKSVEGSAQVSIQSDYFFFVGFLCHAIRSFPFF